MAIPRMTACAPADARARMLALVPAGASASEERRRFVTGFFRRGGFPTRKDEDWRFSGFGALGRIRFQLVDAGSGVVEPWPGETAGEAVLVGGVPAEPALSPPGVRVESFRADAAPEDLFDRDPDGTLRPALPVFLADARDRLHRPGLDLAACFRHPLEMLNAGLFTGGAAVRVAAGVDSGPVLLRSVRGEDAGGAPGMLHPRFLVTLEPRSRATVIEIHEGRHASRQGWTNPSTVVRIGSGARLDYLRLSTETGGGSHTGRTTFHLDRDARVKSTVLSLGRMRHRHDATAVFRGEGSSASLNGLFVGAGRERAEHHTLVVHAARHATSRQLYKAVLADEARTVFDGQVVVAPGAAGSDASQSNRNLLLSDGARAHTQPRLEIHADDVKCAHGAAIGRLDEDALFYLRSRGLGALDSRDLLVEGFAGEIVEGVADERARTLTATSLARVRGRGR